MTPNSPQAPELKTSDMMKKAGVGRNTLRFYEEKGLIKPTNRTRAGYRLYPVETLQDLLFIKQAKAAALTLDEIKDLLALGRTDATTCGVVSKKIEAKVAGIDALMTQLQLRKSFLLEFLGACKSRSETNPCDVRAKGFQPSACCKQK
jgi:MerR family transcriptional regulator, copper efflux regulator